MGQIKYSYNPKTCRYEPASLSIWKITGYAILFISTSSILFVGLLVLHSKFFTTDNAIALREENKALKHHYGSLQNELSTIEGVLVKIKSNEAELQKKLFNESHDGENETNLNGNEKQRILLAGASGFQNLIQRLREKSSSVRSISQQHDGHFSNFSVTNKDLVFLMHMPSITPIELTDITKLVSGFGKRINPFHKGNYDHPGADFAAVRGTSVFATANGRVVKIVSNSSLQAGYGNYIEINHGNNIITRYAHLEEVLVKSGQKITKQQVIGTVGSSGGSVSPHLHYEIIRSGEAVNPVPYMMERISSKQYAELQKLGGFKNQSLD